ncbi:unnamed protein product, partial [Choristocarpus tenellus]
MIITQREWKKSSGVQVAVVAPKSVRVLSFDGDIPEYNPRTVLVVFPSERSICWDELPPSDLHEVERVILVDSGWERTGPILKHPNLEGLRHVRIRSPPARSCFWRWHIKGEGHICTAEATYFVLKEFELASGRVSDGGKLEEILFLFALMHDRIKVS